MKNINKNRSFPNLPVRQGLGNLPLSESFVKKELSSYFIKQVEDPRQKLSGMTPWFDNSINGFTLIELLVVVLIIGILAAVAVPQYQKAVTKAHSAQALTLLKSLGQAADTYFLANGAMPASFDELPLEVNAWNGSTKWYDDAAITDTRSNNEWSLQLHASGIYIGLIDGPYKGAGFAYYTTDNYYHMPERQILCMERMSGGANFEKTQGAYCSQIMKGAHLGNYNTVYAYTLN